MKKCPKCNITKSRSDFYRNPARHDGLASYCKPCFYTYSRETWERKKQDSEWLENHERKKRERDVRWYAKTKEKRVEMKRKSRASNPGSDKAASKRWRSKNPGKYRKAVIESKRKNPAKYREISERKRARRLGQLGKKLPNIKEMLGLQKNKCYYCQVDLDTTGYHEEHKTPLSRGGLHSENNVCLSCPPCNSRKSTKTEEEFLTLFRKENQQ